MKKIAKIIALVAMSLVLCLGVVAFAACGGEEPVTYYGQYHYPNAWDATAPHYGVKVNVTVKGETITKVEIIESDEYTEVSAGWTDKEVWNSGKAALLASYEGKTVSEILAVTGSIKNVDGGTEDKVSNENYVVAGATQGSVRVLKAVQNALNSREEKSYTGEYHYPNAWDATAPHYGVKVKVSVKEYKVTKVEIVNSDYTEVSAGWDNKSVWENGVAGLLASYEGKTVSEIMAVTGSINKVDGGTEDKVSNENYVVAGATQGSVRVLKAVQNALAAL